MESLGLQRPSVGRKKKAPLSDDHRPPPRIHISILAFIALGSRITSGTDSFWFKAALWLITDEVCGSWSRHAETKSNLCVSGSQLNKQFVPLWGSRCDQWHLLLMRLWLFKCGPGRSFSAAVPLVQPSGRLRLLYSWIQPQSNLFHPLLFG